MSSFVKAFGARLRWISAAETPVSAIAYSSVSRFAILLVNIGTGVVVARTLGPVGRGVASATSLWPIVISGLMTLGVPAALRYEVRRGLHKPADLFTSAVLMSGVLGILAFGVGFFVVPLLLEHYPPNVVAFARAMMLFTPFMLCNSVLQAFLESRGDFKRSSMMIYIPPMLTLAALLVLALIHRIGPFAVALTYELPFTLITVVTIYRLRGFFHVTSTLKEHAGRLLHYGLRAYGMDILNVLSGQIDQAMVVGFLSATSFGLYVVAQNAGRLLSIIGSALNTVLFPRAAGLDKQSAVALVSRSARLIFASTAICAVAFVAVLPIVVPLLYGRAYEPVIALAQLLTISAVFGMTTWTFSQAFMATGRPEIATLLQGAGMMLSIPLMLVFIPHFGLTGAAYAVDIASVGRLVFVMIAFPAVLHVRVPGLLPTRSDMRDVVGRLRHAAAAALVKGTPGDGTGLRSW